MSCTDDNNKSSVPRNVTPPMMWAELPSDILSSIFLLCIDNCRFIVPQSFSGLGVPVDPRIILSCVCSHWRSVALRTSALWNDILLELDSPQITFVATQVLERARKTPLRIAARMSRFQNRAPPNPSPEDFINMIIVPHTQHLRTLELFVPFPFIKSILALIHNVQFPTLEVLSLRQASIGTIVDFSTDATNPPICLPNVKSLELDVRWSKPLLDNSVGLPLDTVPWSQLTTFVNLKEMPIRAFGAILSFCPLLESCGVYLEYFALPPYFPQITVAFLERLHIRFTHTAWWCRFLRDSFSLPSLRDLALKVDKEGLGWTTDLTEFLCNQCGSQLESLYVASRETNAFLFDTGLRDIENFFQRHAPSLRQLYIPLFSRSVTLDIETLRRLVSRELCPCLEKLWFENLNWPSSHRLSAVVEGMKDSVNSTREALRELHIICYYHGRANRYVKQAINDMIQEFSRTDIKFHASYIDVKDFNLSTLEKDWFGYLA